MNGTADARTLEDFSVGDRFQTGSVTVTEDEIIAFGRQYDPQAFHVDPRAASDSFFGERGACPSNAYGHHRVFKGLRRRLAPLAMLRHRHATPS